MYKRDIKIIFSYKLGKFSTEIQFYLWAILLALFKRVVWSSLISSLQVFDSYFFFFSVEREFLTTNKSLELILFISKCSALFLNSSMIMAIRYIYTIIAITALHLFLVPFREELNSLCILLMAL